MGGPGSVRTQSWQSGLSLTAVAYVLASICNAVVEHQPHKENLKRMLLALDREEGSRERQGTLSHFQIHFRNQISLIELITIITKQPLHYHF